MKNLKVWLVFLPLLSISCSDEYTSEITESASAMDYKETPIEDSQVIPATVSVAEYSETATEEDRRKDKDWEISVTRIVPKKSQTKQSIVSENRTDEITAVSVINNTAN